jgi:hypothetical protein
MTPVSPPATGIDNMATEINEILKSRIRLCNDIEIDVSKFKAKISSYLELQDRVILKLWTDVDANKEKPGFVLCRNLFCYRKQDGSLIWQVEQPYDGFQPDKPLLDEVFKFIGLSVLGHNGLTIPLSENGSIVKEHRLENGSIVSGQVYLNQFRYGIDRLKTLTLSNFPNEYWVDYETGKLEWIQFHQKI